MESDMTDTDFAMFGMTKADIRDQYINSISAKLVGTEMVVLGILSDCQEMMARRNPTIPHPNVDEFIRQQLNVAKFILSEMMTNKQKSA
jgi:hypothetical protein